MKGRNGTTSRQGATGAAIRTYRAALNFLNTKTNYEKMTRVGYNHTNFNLSRMLRVLSKIGNPHKTLRCVHVAGTKGKGSTCHMIAAMLHSSGYKTGLYTSPHFLDLRERIAVNGEMIAESEFTKLMARLAPVAESLSKDPPTFFELLTAAAFLHFKEQKVEFAVLETGLGGRLDSTNVCKPEACGIVNISFDHMAQLGNTLEKIAEEKAGIFKPGIPIVSAPQKSGVAKVLRAAAERAKSELRFVGEDIDFSARFESSRSTGPQTRVCMTTPTSRFDHVHVPLLGEHQAENCGVALGIIDILRKRGFEIEEQKAIEGLANVQAQGRLEQIQDHPRVIVDAAHNAASVAALMRAIGQNIHSESMVLIFGCLIDKDIDGMLNEIQLGADKIIFTKASSPRAAEPSELLLRFQEKSQKMAQVSANLVEAYNIAKHCVSRDDLICITGSIYLVGEAKRLQSAGKLG